MTITTQETHKIPLTHRQGHIDGVDEREPLLSRNGTEGSYGIYSGNPPRATRQQFRQINSRNIEVQQPRQVML